MFISHLSNSFQGNLQKFIKIRELPEMIDIWAYFNPNMHLPQGSSAGMGKLVLPPLPAIE